MTQRRHACCAFARQRALDGTQEGEGSAAPPRLHTPCTQASGRMARRPANEGRLRRRSDASPPPLTPPAQRCTAQHAPALRKSTAMTRHCTSTRSNARRARQSCAERPQPTTGAEAHSTASKGERAIAAHHRQQRATPAQQRGDPSVVSHCTATTDGHRSGVSDATNIASANGQRRSAAQAPRATRARARGALAAALQSQQRAGQRYSARRLRPPPPRVGAMSRQARRHRHDSNASSDRCSSRSAHQINIWRGGTSSAPRDDDRYHAQLPLSSCTSVGAGRQRRRCSR